jgi:beta-N-acetylhexosaminidase
MLKATENLTTAQKAGQLFIIGIPGPEIDPATRDLLDEISPGGVCLFARNIREADQTRELTERLRGSLPVTPIIAIDQEGGLVDRLRRVLVPMPAANTIATPQDAGLLAGIIAEALSTLGINMDFAPVVDVVTADRGIYSNGLISRIFGSTTEETSELAGEFLEVIQRNGILGCLKHFPGLGASQVDSHEELPVVDLSEKELRSTDLVPYKRLLATGDVHAVMVAHAAFPAVSLQETDQNGKLLPSSLSYNFVTGLLRGELRFDGLVITDDLEMGAIQQNYGVGDACKMAISAGADQLAICADPESIREGYRAIVGSINSGEIAEERLDRSLGRIAALKSRLKEPLPYDRSRLGGLSARIADLSGRSHA